MSRLMSPPDGTAVPQSHAAPHLAHQTSALRTQTFKYGDWTVTIMKAPILSSQCTCARDHNPLISTVPVSSQPVESFPTHRKCVFCRHESELTLDHLPDMVFVENKLRIENTDGHFGIEFNAVDAVNSIGERASGDIQVASANVWQESRSEALRTFGSKTVQYDWTFTPTYTGTLFGGMRAERTDETLNQETIKRRDQVLLFEEVQLYGDELDDNGCAEMDLKIRIVDSYLFVLMRFYLRVDHVFVRLYDTRLLLEKGKGFHRESSVRECRIPDLPKDVSPMEPMMIWSGLAPSQEKVEKLCFP